LTEWWEALLETDGPEAVFRRWPTGPAGHPLVLSVFRRYYLQIEELNRRAEETFQDDPPPRITMWGEENLGKPAPLERPVEWLIQDIPEAAPDLADLVGGICFVPVGLNQDNEAV
jgi:hypothetical protein